MAGAIRTTEASMTTSPANDERDAYHKILTVVSIPIAVLGIVSNLLSLSYFITERTGFNTTPQQRSNLTSRLFMTLNVFDLLVCVSMPLLEVTRYHESWIIGNFLHDIFFTVYHCSMYLTGFITCIIAVTRAVDLIWPFCNKNGRRTVTHTAILVYSVIILASVTAHTLTDNYISGSDYDVLAYTSSLLLLVIPTATFAVVIIPNLLCMVQLLNTGSHGVGSTNTRHATVTVGIISLVYCFCNVGFITNEIFEAIYSDEVLPWPTALKNTFSIVMVPLNSACNPAVYFLRKAEMRLYLGDLWRRVVQSSNCVSTQIEPTTTYMS